MHCLQVVGAPDAGCPQQLRSDTSSLLISMSGVNRHWSLRIVSNVDHRIGPAFHFKSRCRWVSYILTLFGKPCGEPGAHLVIHEFIWLEEQCSYWALALMLDICCEDSVCLLSTRVSINTRTRNQKGELRLRSLLCRTIACSTWPRRCQHHGTAPSLYSRLNDKLSS